MDIAALLLLPLVGGYIFANTCNAIRYRAAREEGHRLYFRAAFYGVFLFIATLLLRLLLIAEVELYRDWELWLRQNVQSSLKDDRGDAWLIGMLSVWTLLLGPALAFVLNRLFLWRGYWLGRAIKDDDFEALLHRALARAMPIAMTMENGKVYVGFVVRTFEPKASRHVRILPLMSGYRSERGKVNFTTYYEEAYKSSGESGLTLEDFQMVFPADKIHSANLFDVETYRRFEKLISQDSAATASAEGRKSWRPAAMAGKRTSIWVRS